MSSKACPEGLALRHALPFITRVCVLLRDAQMMCTPCTLTHTLSLSHILTMHLHTVLLHGLCLLPKSRLSYRPPIVSFAGLSSLRGEVTHPGLLHFVPTPWMAQHL